jgi:dienelactone hydrolase
MLIRIPDAENALADLAHLFIALRLRPVHWLWQVALAVLGAVMVGQLEAAEGKSVECRPPELASYLEARAEKLTARAKPPAALSDWEGRREELSKQFFAILGLDPLPEKTPLCPRIAGEPIDLGRSVFHRVVFESRPKNYVAAHLYVPKEIVAPAPAIIYVPGHGKRDHYHQHLVSFAAHGYVALNMPALGDEGKTGGGKGCGHKGPYYDDYHWYSTGYNPAGAEVWDGIRAVDYLLSLRDEKTGKPLVDAARIGITGRSGGAARTLWTLAAEPRILAGVAAEGFTTVAGYRGSLPNTCDVHIFYNYYGLEYGDLYGLAAPRPLLVQHGTTDRLYLSPQGVADYLKSLYVVLGTPDRFAYEVFEQGHADTPELRRSEYAWFDRWLGQGRAGVTPVVDEEVPQVLTQKANVRCFPESPVDAVNIEQQYTPPTPRWEVKSQSDFSRFKQELSAKLRAEALRTAMLPFTAELKQEGGKTSLIVDEGLCHRAAFVSKPGARRKTVVLLDAAGLRRAERLSAAFLDMGVNLLVLEPCDIHSSDSRKNARQHLLRLAALTGETLTSLRVRDALGAVRALAANPAVDPKGIYLWGKGDLAIAALYAAVADDRVAGVLLEDAPDHHTSETAMFRVLRYADVPQAAALLFPRPVFLLGKTSVGFGWTKDVYRLLGQPSRCAESAEGPAGIVARQ